MIDTRKTNLTQANFHDNNDNASCVSKSEFAQLKRYCISICRQYQNVYNDHIKQQKEFEEEDTVLENAIVKLTKDNRTAKGLYDEISAKYQVQRLKKEGLEKKLIHQQQQQSILHDKCLVLEASTQNKRRQNLMIVKEIQSNRKELMTSYQKNALKQEQLSQIELEFKSIISSNQQKIQEMTQIQNKIEQIQTESMSHLTTIESLQNRIYQNTLNLQLRLKLSSELIKRYSDIKQTKKHYLEQIQQAKKRIKQEDNYGSELLRINQQLLNTYEICERQSIIERSDIHKLENSIIAQSLEVRQNRECLQKLQRYLESLVENNVRIERYIEKMFEDDQKIKYSLDAKYYQSKCPPPPPRANQPEICNSSKSTSNSQKWRTQNLTVKLENTTLGSTM